MKTTTTTRDRARKTKKIFLNTVMLISVGLIVYGMLPITMIYTDGAPILAEVFDKSLQERFVQFPDEMKSVTSKMYIYVTLAIVLLVTTSYLYSRLANNEPSTPAQVETQPESMPEDNTPGKKADWDQWHDAYYLIILPFLQDKKNKNEIIQELKDRGYPFSKYTEIRQAGELGQLIEFKKKK